MDFYEKTKTVETNNVDFNVTILTTSYWPTYKSFEITLPRELESCVKQFGAYYQQKHNHRELKWSYSLGSATVSGSFPQSDKKYDLIVGTYQMCILMLFNQRTEITY